MASGREQYLQALASLSDLTRTQAERVAALLAKQGEVQSAQVGRVAEDLMRRTQKNRETMSRLVQREVKRQLGVLGMATRDEVARLQQRVRALEQEVERSPRHGRPRPRPPAKRSTRASAATGQVVDPDPGLPGAAKRRPGPGGLLGAARPPGPRLGRGQALDPDPRGGASSRSSASSPRTRRASSSGQSAPPETGTPS